MESRQHPLAAWRRTLGVTRVIENGWLSSLRAADVKQFQNTRRLIVSKLILCWSFIPSPGGRIRSDCIVPFWAAQLLAMKSMAKSIPQLNLDVIFSMHMV